MGEGDKFNSAQEAPDIPVMRIKGDPEFIPVANFVVSFFSRLSLSKSSPVTKVFRNARTASKYLCYAMSRL